MTMARCFVDFSLTSMNTRSTLQAAKAYGLYQQRKRSCQGAEARPDVGSGSLSSHRPAAVLAGCPLSSDRCQIWAADHCGNGCSFYVFETGEQIERCSY